MATPKTTPAKKNKPTGASTSSKSAPAKKGAPDAKAGPAAKPAPAAKAKPAAKNAKKTPAALEQKLVRATAGLKKEFAKVQSALRKLRGEGTVSFDALYELIGKILASDPPLYVGGGYRTKEDFIAAELPGETLRSVQRNVLVARCFSPEEEASHGIAFLEEVALYARELTGAAEAPPAIDLDKLTLVLPGKGGATVRKKARGATIDDVRQARRALRKGASTRRDASPVETALRAALGAHKALATVTVRATGERASFGNVPVSELAAFSKAVANLKLSTAPKPGSPSKKGG